MASHNVGCRRQMYSKVVFRISKTYVVFVLGSKTYLETKIQTINKEYILRHLSINFQDYICHQNTGKDVFWFVYLIFFCFVLFFFVFCFCLSNYKSTLNYGK